MLEEDKKKLDEIAFMSDRRKAKAIIKYKKSKKRYFILSIVLSIAVIIACYFLSNVSNVKKIIVEGNIYLKDEDIINVSMVNESSEFLLAFKSNVAKNVLSSPFINECLVEKLDGNVIKIIVQEKTIIGYGYENDENVLFLNDDSKVSVDKNNLYLIEKVPLIKGFSQEDLLLLEKNMSELDYKMINEISEIHYYPSLKYQYVEILMRDGNYVFTSPYGLNILDKYYDMLSSYGVNSNSCFYFEDISGNAYVSSCPWILEEVVETQTEQQNIE